METRKVQWYPFSAFHLLFCWCFIPSCLEFVWFFFTWTGFSLTILMSCSKTFVIHGLLWSTFTTFCKKHLTGFSCSVDKHWLSNNSLLICGYSTNCPFCDFIFRTVNNRSADQTENTILSESMGETSALVLSIYFLSKLMWKIFIYPCIFSW